MHIDIQNFTPASALTGGLILGLSTAILALFNGRVAGISSILSNVLDLKSQDKDWRVAFVFGMVLVSFFWFFLTDSPANVTGNYWVLVISGLLIGFGSKLGSGCTSGHGICGIARLSKRSIVATITFMIAAILTTTVARLLG